MKLVTRGGFVRNLAKIHPRLEIRYCEKTNFVKYCVSEIDWYTVTLENGNLATSRIHLLSQYGSWLGREFCLHLLKQLFRLETAKLIYIDENWHTATEHSWISFGCYLAVFAKSRNALYDWRVFLFGISSRSVFCGFGAFAKAFPPLLFNGAQPFYTFLSTCHRGFAPTPPRGRFNHIAFTTA